jgi:hypothetical protein
MGRGSTAKADLGKRVAGKRRLAVPGFAQIEGWITAEWKTSDLGRRAKFYSLTRLGRKQLEKECGNWERLSAAINSVVNSSEA